MQYTHHPVIVRVAKHHHHASMQGYTMEDEEYDSIDELGLEIPAGELVVQHRSTV